MIRNQKQKGRVEMKRVWSILLLLGVLLSCLAGCAGGGKSAPSGSSVQPSASGTPEPVQTSAPPEAEEVTVGPAELEELLVGQPLAVVDTEYVVQDEQYKSLYPDMLQATLKSAAPADIKDAVVAFAAWDKNDLPVKIKGSIDFSGGAYIKEVNYSDINLIPGDTFGDSYGFEVDEACGIQRFVAIAVSYDTFEGDSWENPYYDAWREMYEGQKYSDDLTVTTALAPETEQTAPSAPVATPERQYTPEELQNLIDQQELRVISTKYVVQDEQYKALYPDMLQAVVESAASADIKDAVVAFVAWDKNGLPVKIKGAIDFSGGSYVQLVNYSDINLVPGGSFGSASGYEIDEACGIQQFKAIAVSYETFEGDSWENPYYDAWRELYEGQKLAS